jgi:hypothetical protein
MRSWGVVGLLALALLAGGCEDVTTAPEPPESATEQPAGQSDRAAAKAKAKAKAKARRAKARQAKARARRRAAAAAAAAAATPAPTPTPTPTPEPEPACHPDYEGACLDPNSYDYDCEGGSGDGPDYTGTVRSVGSDPYDLDRDGDGIACDA